MNLKKILPLIGIVIFVYLLYKIGLNNLWLSLSTANLFYMLLAVFVAFFVIIPQTFKWFYIARIQGINLSFREAIRINIISNFYGLITPSKIGSALRITYLKPYTKNIGKGVSNFIFDKLFDISSLAFLSVFFVVLFNETFSFISQTSLILILVGMVLITLLLRSKKTTKFLLRGVYRKIIPKTLQPKTKNIFDSFYDQIPRKREFFVAFLLNLLTWVAVYLSTFLVAKSLAINLPFIYFLAILPLGTLISMIPITINGLGTREAALIGLFGLFNVRPEKIFLMSILTIFINGCILAFLSLIAKSGLNNESSYRNSSPQ